MQYLSKLFTWRKKNPDNKNTHHKYWMLSIKYWNSYDLSTISLNMFNFCCMQHSIYNLIKITSLTWSPLLIRRVMRNLRKPCYRSPASDLMSWIYIMIWKIRLYPFFPQSWIGRSRQSSLVTLSVLHCTPHFHWMVHMVTRMEFP